LRTCPNCGRVHGDDREVCDCGEYLAWDPQASGPRGTAVHERAAGWGSTEAVILALRLADQEPGAPLHVRVVPGQRVGFLARIRNQSGIVDNYDLVLEGLPAGWWTIAPATVYLLPLGTEGSFETEVEVEIHPPLSPDAEAREWGFDLTAVSRATGEEVARAGGSVTIDPYTRVDMAVRPQRVRGRRRARVAVAMQNRGNAVSSLALTAVDADDACRFAIPHPQLALGRGEGLVDTVEVQPRRPLVIGRPVERRLEFEARSPALDEEPVRGAATFVQRPYLPWWIAVVVPLLAAALLALLLLRPDTVTVPDLRKASSIVEAQALVEEAGLDLDRDIQRRPTAARRPGAILVQSPKPGEEAEEGDAVTIEVAVGTGRDKIPDLVKLKAAEAEAALDEAGFTIGATDPRLDPGYIVTAQIPEAGEVRPAGTPVNLFLEPAPRKRGKGRGGAAGGAAAGGAGGGGGGGGGKGLVVPALEGVSLREGIAALRDDGLVRGAVRRAISTERRGTVLRSVPPEGAPAKPGQAVRLVVSAGYPRLAIGDGDRVLTVGGAGGAAPRTVAADVPSRQPAWTAAGGDLAYVADGRIFLVDARDRDAAPAPLTPADGANYARPSFAPTRARRVMAFLRARAGDGDLCFAAVAARSATAPRCVPDPDIDLNGPPAWSPRGTEILVPGVVSGTDGRRFGLVRYRSATPFSTRASDWRRGRVVTDLAREGRGVIRAAYAPDGKRLALISNLRGGAFRLVIAKPDDLLLEDAETLPLPACDVAWRPDGRQLVIVIADPRCAERTGALARVDPGRPGNLAMVRPLAADPAWEPVDLR